MKKKFLLFLLILLIILALAFVFILKPKIVNSLLEKAENHIDLKKYSTAEKVLDLVYILDGKNPHAYILGYRLLLFTGKEEEILDFTKNAYSKTNNQFFENLSTHYQSETDTPKLNFESGVYGEEFMVKVINQKENEKIFYSLNGETSFYTGEIKIPKGRSRILIYKDGQKGGREYIFYVGDYSKEADFSHESGFYNEEFFLNITAEGEVFYTLDGLSPTEKSEKYISPIKISDTAIFRYYLKTQKGETETFTKYFIFDDNKMQQNSTAKAEDYSINSSKGYKIYKGKDIITALSASDLCIGEDDIYFISSDFKKGVYKVSKGGGFSQLIIDGDVSSLKNIGSILFYIKDSDLYIYGGKTEEKLIENISQYVIKNGEIYYTSGEILYKTSLFAKEKTQILEGVTSFDVSEKGEIYYLSPHRKLYKNENLIAEKVSSFAISPYGENLAYVMESALICDGEKVTNGYIYSPSFSENSLCYYLIDEKGEYIREYNFK